MPITDLEKRRAYDRDRRRKARNNAWTDAVRAVGDGRKHRFASWLLLVSSELKGRRSWSDRLARAMYESDEYDRYLRTVADAKVLPTAKTAFKIGEGLRKGGVAWCSGALALQIAGHTTELHAVIDDVSRVNRDASEMWLLVARTVDASLRLRNPNLAPPNTVVRELTDCIHAETLAAWRRFEATGAPKIRTLFGLAKLVLESPAIADDSRKRLYDDVMQTWQAGVDGRSISFFEYMRDASEWLQIRAALVRQLGDLA